MIDKGRLVVLKEKNINLKTLSIRTACDGIREVANRHGWELSDFQIMRLAEEFVETHYLEFNVKKNGNLTYPLNRLEVWILQKKHHNEEMD